MKYFIKNYDTRFFAGIEFPGGINPQAEDIYEIPDLWERLFGHAVGQIDHKVVPHHFIGLECYPFDFSETGSFDYFALVETERLIDVPEGLVTKKLKKGRYICFPIHFDHIREEIQQVYAYIKAERIHIHMGFDYEDYLVEENYGERGAILNFCLLLDENAE